MSPDWKRKICAPWVHAAGTCCWCSYVVVEDAIDQLVSHTGKLIFRLAFARHAIEKRIVRATFYDILLGKCEKCGAEWKILMVIEHFRAWFWKHTQAGCTKSVASPSLTSMKISSTRLAMAHRAHWPVAASNAIETSFVACLAQLSQDMILC